MKKRSKRYQESKGKIKSQAYPLDEAIKLAKELSTAKFDESLELHLRLGVDPSKSDQQVRGTITLPHSSGKTKTVAVFAEGAAAKEAKEAGAEIIGGEELIDEIKKTKKINFDVAIATPEMMSKMGQIARILGPKGLMPNPKTETVTPNVKKAIEENKKGKANFKLDDGANLHQVFGKKSLEDTQLKENLDTLLEAIKKAKPENTKGVFIKAAYISTTMGPSIKTKIK